MTVKTVTIPFDAAVVLMKITPRGPGVLSVDALNASLALVAGIERAIANKATAQDDEPEDDGLGDRATR